MKKAVCMLFAIAALALSAMGSPAVAQDNYPTSPIRLVVGVGPGGTGDLVARLVAQKLSAQLNANVVVDNRLGADGNIGAEFVAKSKPDGYTLLLNSNVVILSRAFDQKLGYDVFKDLAPVALVTISPFLLVVHPSVPVNTVAELIAHLRANPDKLNFGSGGIGSMIHLVALLFLQANGVTAVHVPYNGAGPMLLDVVAGRIQFTMQSIGPVLPLVKDKRLQALAITSLKRSALLPDVPTLAETVMPGLNAGGWFGVMAPAKTPPAIVKRLNSEIMSTLQDPDMKSRLAQAGAEPLGSTPEEYGVYLRTDLERWSKVIKSANLKSE